MSETHFINDQWVAPSELKISAFDLGITRGLAVFDTLRTHNSKPFLLKRHLKRFRQSASAIDIEIKYSDNQLSEIIHDGLKKNGRKESVIRLNLTAGINEGRLSSTKPNLFIMFLPLSLPTKEKYTTGQSLKSIVVNRTLPQHKTINYVSAKLGLMAADEAGADEALYLDSDNNVLETTISNIFFWQGNRLVTPSNDNILPGITRQLVLELSKKINFEVIERKIPLDEISKFDEAFACSSIKEILAINSIDNHTFSNGKLGPKTDSFTKEFKKYVLELSELDG